MKKLFFLFTVTSASFLHAQDVITVPERTPVSMILTEDIFENKTKTGAPARFIVAEDVTVDGVVVISKNSVVKATVSLPVKRELRVDLIEVPAVDGTPIKLMDCWKATTAAQNLNGKVALLPKNTRKNCFTIQEVKVKKAGGKF